MTSKEFSKSLEAPAKKINAEFGLNYLAIIAQAALETGWGKKAIGNNYFGIKADKNWRGLKQLVQTTEFHTTDIVIYPEIISITKLTTGKYKYIVKDWFRDYATLEDCLKDHFLFFVENKRYSEALKYKDNPYLFVEEIAKAGYATAPDYANTLKSIINTVKKHLDS